MKKHLFNTDKLKYVSGERPDVPCILCAINEGNPEIESLEVYRTEHFIIAVNLYPYNPGHLMIFPRRHVEDLGDLADEEALELHRLLTKTLEILKKEFNPTGFNAGYNLGENSGASIAHVHLHVLPRFDTEIGFIEILSGTKLVVSDPAEVRDRLRERFKEKSMS